jgi:hypothetical protein
MSMETFPVNAADITHLQTSSKGYLLQLQRNASVHIFCELQKQNKRNVRAPLGNCANIFLGRWRTISFPGSLSWLRAKC